MTRSGALPAAPLPEGDALDALARVVVDRHLTAAGRAPIPTSGNGAFRQQVGDVLGALVRDEANDGLLRALLGELHALFTRVLDAHDAHAVRNGGETTWQSPEHLISALGPRYRAVDGSTQVWLDRLARLRTLMPPESARETARLDAIDEENLRRQRDESGY